MKNIGNFFFDEFFFEELTELGKFTKKLKLHEFIYFNFTVLMLLRILFELQNTLHRQI